MGDVLRVSLIQTDIVWEDKRANLDKYAAILSHITGDCDLVVFPEMFTTGFSMRVEDLAECIEAGIFVCSFVMICVFPFGVEM